MEYNKEFFLKYSPWVLSVVLAALLYSSYINKETVKIPIRVEVEVPVKVHSFDTIYEPKPYKVFVNLPKVDEFVKSNPEEQIILYKEAVTENSYENTFEDSVQTIKVTSIVEGKLKGVSVDYKTKPSSVFLDTVIEKRVLVPKRSLIIYSEAGTGLNKGSLDNNLNSVIFKVGLDYKSKNKWIYGGSYDTQKRVWVKLGKSFDF